MVCVKILDQKRLRAFASSEPRTNSTVKLNNLAEVLVEIPFGPSAELKTKH